MKGCELKILLLQDGEVISQNRALLYSEILYHHFCTGSPVPAKAVGVTHQACSKNIQLPSCVTTPLWEHKFGFTPQAAKCPLELHKELARLGFYNGSAACQCRCRITIGPGGPFIGFLKQPATKPTRRHKSSFVKTLW